MKTVTVTIKGVSPLQMGRYHKAFKLEKESNEDYEKRTWRDKAHCDKDGKVYIPGNAVKNMLRDTSKYLGLKIPGKGKNTYTKHFEAGILAPEPLYIGCTLDDAKEHWVFGDARGKRGGNNPRVEKCFPLFEQWGGSITFYILDETLTEGVLEEHFMEAGKFIGLMCYRPINGGHFGRFEVVDLKIK